MIEINLSPSKSGGDVLNVGGLDLSHLNIKMIIIGILFLYIPEMLVSGYYEEEIKQITTRELAERKQVRKLRSKVKGLENIKKQVDALKKQEQVLAKRLGAVKIIINKRQNPYKLLSYIAENTPKTVWLTQMKLEDKNLVLSGHAENWKDIGSFLEGLKNSIFFTNIQYKVPENAKTDYNGRKVEVFQVTAQVVRFK